MNKLTALNLAQEPQAVALIEPLIERAPKIAPKVIRHRPFETAGDLTKAIHHELHNLTDQERLELFRSHPELAPENPFVMTKESQSEQGRLNLTSANSEFKAQLCEMNATYQSKFGFPFIVALVRHENMDSVMSEFQQRLTADHASEVAEALRQVGIVSSARVEQTFGEVRPDAASVSVERQ